MVVCGLIHDTQKHFAQAQCYSLPPHTVSINSWIGTGPCQTQLRFFSNQRVVDFEAAQHTLSLNMISRQRVEPDVPRKRRDSEKFQLPFPRIQWHRWRKQTWKSVSEGQDSLSSGQNLA